MTYRLVTRGTVEERMMQVWGELGVGEVFLTRGMWGDDTTQTSQTGITAHKHGNNPLPPPQVLVNPLQMHPPKQRAKEKMVMEHPSPRPPPKPPETLNTPQTFKNNPNYKQRAKEKMVMEHLVVAKLKQGGVRKSRLEQSTLDDILRWGVWRG